VKAPGPIGTSIRQVELLERGGESWVGVQVLQKRVDFGFDQSTVTKAISSVEPLERFVGLIPECINAGDQVLIACMLRLLERR
jgi:hypothetical protein